MVEEMVVDKFELMAVLDAYEHARIRLQGLAGLLDSMKPDEMRDDVAEQAVDFLAEGAFAAADCMEEGREKLSSILKACV